MRAVEFQGRVGAAATKWFGKQRSNMTVRDLDRLVSKTELTPLTKTALRGVRKAIMSGRTGNAEIGHASWSVEVQSLNGTPLRIRFSFKRDK